MQLSSPVTALPRVGEIIAKKIQKLGIASIRDLLFHFPREYLDLSRVTSIASLKEGEVVCIQGTLKSIAKERTFKKQMVLVHALVEDTTGATRIVWFNQPYLLEALKPGEKLSLAGKVAQDSKGLFLSNPEYEKVKENTLLAHTGRLVPVYAETAGVTSKLLRYLTFTALSSVLATLSDSLPLHILKEKNFPSLSQALQQIHFPSSLKEEKRARERFAFEELFTILLFVVSERKKIARIKAPAIPFLAELMKRCTDSLPFKLTDSQKKSAWQILKDMEKPRPMNRLLQGDVGSGKTVVAAMAALSAVKAGYQVAFLAPTEILAKQHFQTVTALLAPFKINLGLLTGSVDHFMSKKLPGQHIEISRRKLLEKAREGGIDILIGTHAIIQKEVKFANLALVVVDEQHRFGVKQRAQLLHRSTLIPHLLSMTATPIPRTLALTVYGDLDLSLIKELPAGRKKIETKIVAPEDRESAYQFVREEIKKGGQVFVICPRIEKSNESQITDHGSQVNSRFQSTSKNWANAKAVLEEYELLSKKIFPEYAVGMLHGKISGTEKERTMKQMRAGKIKILVSTSVVEVGVDIPNATVMLIEGTEHFGLAQLHQFRGRVGRSNRQSFCLLFTESSSFKTKQRLKAIRESENGFELAEKDLKLRGPGDFTGVKQWGLPDFAMQQLTNIPLVEEAREAALALVEEDITLSNHPLLKARIEEMRKKLHME
ncbi:MAG: ATP-dependent DNA helicase RecG [bacterium]|nr:ATP-dependent DNA helicase RecG [bacterium]